jgi:hypothetical protein
MSFLSKIFSILSIIWYTTIINYCIYEYFEYSTNSKNLENKFKYAYDSISVLDEQYYFKRNAQIPIHDRLYLLSYKKNHIFSLAYMNTSNEVKYFIFINYDKNKNIFCKKISNIPSIIIANLSETNNRYYAVKNYGNTYFTNLSFDLVKILSIDLSIC